MSTTPQHRNCFDLWAALAAILCHTPVLLCLEIAVDCIHFSAEGATVFAREDAELAVLQSSDYHRIRHAARPPSAHSEHRVSACVCARMLGWLRTREIERRLKETFAVGLSINAACDLGNLAIGAMDGERFRANARFDRFRQFARL